jgi:EmrB/QacA subfamily drug resistance transporter
MNGRTPSIERLAALQNPARLNSVIVIKSSERQQPDNPWITFGLVVVGTFMIMLDASIVNISLPSIAQTFHTPVGGAMEWIIIAYLVIIAATLLTFGRLSDMIGRKPVWLAGIALFTIGSGICGAANSLPLLIAARAFQGLGGALLFSTSLAIITDTFPVDKRGLVMGCNVVVIGLGSSVGPIVGGLITEHWSWRWIFYVNIPVGIIGFVGAQKVLRDTFGSIRQQFDLPGAVLFAAIFAPLTLVLSFASEWGWSSWRSLLCFSVSLAALLALPAVERRAADPIIHVRLLRNSVFTSSLITMTLGMLALFAIGFILPFYFEELRGFSTAKSGLLLTAMPLNLAIMAPLSGSLADRFGSRWLASGGLAVACLGLCAVARLDAQSSDWDIIWPLLLTGAGQGMFMTPNARALMNSAPASEQGESSGLLGTGRVLGQSMSVALAGAIFTGLGGAAAGRTLLEAKAVHPGVADEITAAQLNFLTGFHAALLACAGVAAVGILTALVRGPETKPAVRAISPARITKPIPS